MRHIPEDELHAYLDQALSRLQCVEIERHLASCRPCRAERDRIAALRDRTTALLAVLAPPLTPPPSFDVIRDQARGRHSRRHRLMRVGIWAASLVAAVGLGWSGHRWLDDGGAAGAPNQEAVSIQEAAAAQSSSIPDSSRSSTPAPRQTVTDPVPPPQPRKTPVQTAAATPPRTETARDSAPPRAPVTPVVHRPSDPAPLPGSQDTGRFSQANSMVLADEPDLAELATESMWRLVSVAAAEEESGAPLPQVAGLPVVQVKVQGLRPNEKIVAVDQQLATGEVIRTMEGPADQMTDLLARDGRGLGRTSAASRALEALMTMRFGDRIVAIRGPADSLRALMNRLPVPKTKQE